MWEAGNGIDHPPHVKQLSDRHPNVPKIIKNLACVFLVVFCPTAQKKSSGAIFHRFPSERPWVGHNGPPQKRADSQFTHSQSTTPPPIPAGPRWRKDREIDAWKMVTISAFFTTGSWIPSLKIRREDTPILYKVAGRYDYKKKPQ